MPSNEDLERWVLAVAQDADRQAFACLFRHLAPRIKAFMQRGGCTPAQAEEIAQETLATLWRKASLFDATRAAVSTWVFTIARNLRIDLLRRQANGAVTVELEAGSFEDAAVEPAPRPDEQASAGQRASRVRAALARLPEEQAVVLRLSFFEDHPHAEIARELDLPLGTVKSRIRIAVNQLRRLLDELQ